MSSSYPETSERSSAPATADAAAYGGLVDAIGGIATIVLAIIALTGEHWGVLVSVAVIVFGASLLVQGGTMLSEYASIMFPTGGESATSNNAGVGSLSSLFLVGVAGIILGILALIGVETEVLNAIAIIAFGGALLMSSNSVRSLYMIQSSARRSSALPGQGDPGQGGEMLAGEMAAGSAGVQLVAGLAAVVLGILAVVGIHSNVLMLAALIVLGATVLLTGSALSGMVVGFMRSATQRRSEARRPAHSVVP